MCVWRLKIISSFTSPVASILSFFLPNSFFVPSSDALVPTNLVCVSQGWKPLLVSWSFRPSDLRVGDWKRSKDRGFSVFPFEELHPSIHSGLVLWEVDCQDVWHFQSQKIIVFANMPWTC